MAIENNIEICREAEAVFLLAQEAAAKVSEEHSQRFWVVIQFHVAKALGLVVRDDRRGDGLRMTEAQAKAFERALVPWGKHVGQPGAEVELDYLFWVVEQRDEFKEDLRRYLRSDRVQKDQAD